MKNLLRNLWDDEQGAVLSAEAVMLGTVGVLGAGVGANMVTDSINSEMQDVAYAFRHLDQSYCYSGFSSPHACVAGSSFEQEDIAISLKEMGDIQRHEGKVDRKRRGEDSRKNPKKKQERRNRKQDSSLEVENVL